MTTRRCFLRLASLSTLGAAAGTIMGCATAGTGGRRLAMAIDPGKCLQKDGCRACIDACHRAHNVPPIPDREHEVKWIWKERAEDAFASEDGGEGMAPLGGRPVLVLCNHCENPPCVRVCPTRATWKREDGVVMMDEHRCIGCRYCMAACPYGSRSFNWVDPRPHVTTLDPGYPTRTKGVVEKCTFCDERLARGEQPLCVEACPERAIVFGDLRDPASPIRQLTGSRYTMRRKPELGTRPQVYYLI
ncbi:MAG TPA: 4Fe-4S dicluster domain-containing protein [Vicinamibacterales bacterium]|jgi:molybdopterin-containing oxidoreductase family iron-sulfur binding subunit